jgi:hypothetical protein
MATDDDDILTGPVPLPEAEPTASERAHAKTFADLVDKTLAGRTPAAMSADDRALLEVATVIRAASGNVELAPAKRHSLVEDALRQAVGGAGAGTSARTSGRTSGSVVPITRARRRWMPWAIAGASTLVAAAAVLLLWLRGAPAQNHADVARAPTPARLLSRPADALIGPIPRDRVGDASTRIDAIYADRLDGYRELQLARGRKP